MHITKSNTMIFVVVITGCNTDKSMYITKGNTMVFAVIITGCNTEDVCILRKVIR